MSTDINLTYAGGRRVEPWLGVAIVAMPLIFTWFVIRPGYSPRVRLMSFGWLAVAALIGALTGGSADHASAPPSAAPATQPVDPSSEQKPSGAESGLTDHAKAVERCMAPYANGLSPTQSEGLRKACDEDPLATARAGYEDLQREAGGLSQ